MSYEALGPAILFLALLSLYYLKTTLDAQRIEKNVSELGENYQNTEYDSEKHYSWTGTIRQYPVTVVPVNRVWWYYSVTRSFEIFVPIHSDTSVEIKSSGYFGPFSNPLSKGEHVEFNGNLSESVVRSDNPTAARRILKNLDFSVDASRLLSGFSRIRIDAHQDLLQARFKVPSDRLNAPPLRERTEQIIELISVLPDECSVTSLGEPSSSDPEPKLKLGRYGHDSSLHGNRIYTSAGLGGNDFLTNVEVFNIGEETSEVVVDDIRPRRYHVSEVHDDYLFVIGGENANGLVRDIDVINLQTHEVEGTLHWSNPRKLMASVKHNSKIYLLGGVDNRGHPTDDVQVLDCETQSWGCAISMPESKCPSAVIQGDKIIVVGGYVGSGQSDKCHYFDVSDREDRWRSLPDIPEKTSANSLVAVDGRLYSFGDYEVLDRVYCFESGEWTRSDIQFRKSRHNSAVVSGRTIYVIGGNVSSTYSYLDYIQQIKVD